MKRYLITLLILLNFCTADEAPRASHVTPNAPVILISVDTLRADHLPAYGYKGVETPNIDALRRDSILFSNAWSHVPLTLPSHVSILTGHLPTDHGVRDDIGFPFDADRHPTIPSIVKRSGYLTGAAVSGYVLRGGSGLAQAFDFYDDEIAADRRAGVDTVIAAERWIDVHVQQPFFFMLHLFETHAPRRTTYDGEIFAADAAVGRFIQFLKRVGAYDRALIIFLSDHGEGLGDHGEVEHGIFVYRETLHVPLMVKLPESRLAGRTTAAPVQLIDVLPTVTGVLGLDAPERLKGRSLVATATAPFPPRRIYSESLYPRIHLGWSDLRSLVDDRFHLIEAPRPELYATSDVREVNNVVAANRPLFAQMRRELDIYGRDTPVIGNIDPLQARKLAALGYLTAASEQSAAPHPDPKERIAELRLIAAGKYREVLERNPLSTEAWTLRGRELSREGRHDEAIAAFKRAIRISPSLAGEISLLIAEEYLALDKPDVAVEHAQIGLITNPGRARLILAGAALAKNDLETASREAAQAISALGYRAPGQIAMAQVLVKQGRVTEAAGMIEQAFEEVAAKKLEPPPLIYYVHGEILARQGDLDGAAAAFSLGERASRPERSGVPPDR